MFERVKFRFYSAKMKFIFELAFKAKKNGNDRQALRLLRKALEAGHMALSIKSPKISKEKRQDIADLVSSGQELLQKELIAQLPEESRELLVSAITESSKNMEDLVIMDATHHPIEKKSP